MKYNASMKSLHSYAAIIITFLFCAAIFLANSFSRMNGQSETKHWCELCMRAMLEIGFIPGKNRRIYNESVEADTEQKWPGGIVGGVGKWDLRGTQRGRIGNTRQVALCISGQLRSTALTASQVLRHFAEPLDAELFIHTSQKEAAASKSAQTPAMKNRMLVLSVLIPLLACKVGCQQIYGRGIGRGGVAASGESLRSTLRPLRA